MISGKDLGVDRDAASVGVRQRVQMQEAGAHARQHFAVWGRFSGEIIRVEIDGQYMIGAQST